MPPKLCKLQPLPTPVSISEVVSTFSDFKMYLLILFKSKTFSLLLKWSKTMLMFSVQTGKMSVLNSVRFYPLNSSLKGARTLWRNGWFHDSAGKTQDATGVQFKEFLLGWSEDSKMVPIQVAILVIAWRLEFIEERFPRKLRQFL